MSAMKTIADPYEAIEVAACIFGLDADDESIDDEVERHLDERWGIDLDTFANISGELLKMTPTMQSPLSEKQFHVLGRRDGAAFVALMKTESGGQE